MKHTCEQHDAIHISDANLIVVAGAGAGKTRVLVDRYLQLLADNPDWPINALVAITFTREAAFEMRQRVRLEVERRSQQDSGDHWARHQSQLDSARIDTIHGLCASLLRANAAQAGIDPLFTVLDENEAAILLDDIVSDVLATIEAPQVRLFAHYDAFMIDRTLKQMSLVNSEREPLPADPEVLFAQWEREWSEEVIEARAQLLASAELADIPTAGPTPNDDKLAKLIEQYRRYFARIEAETDAGKIARLMSDCHKEGAVGGKGAAKAWGGKQSKDEAANALRRLRDRIKATLDSIGEPPGELDRAAAELLPLWDGLLRRVTATYRARKAENAQLDFDDLERLTAALLCDSAVQDRYRLAEFKHLLVDEFQDTNAAQWFIIRALADLERRGSLFVVGDPKQSIYQFRGADVSVFNTVRKQIAGHRLGRELRLSISFRSHRPLIEQFNALFAEILKRDENSPVKEFQVEFDTPMKADRKDPPSLPAIELLLLDSDERDETGEIAKEPNGRRRAYSADEMRGWEAYEIGTRIKAMIAAGRPIFDKDEELTRGLEYRDAAVLFQSTSKLTLYEEVFKSLDIPYLTIAGRGYFDRQEVWDMLDLLRFLHNPADSLSLATVLRSPIFAFSDDLLFALRLIVDDDEAARAPRPLWQALHIAREIPSFGIAEADLPLIKHAIDTLQALRRMAGRVTISELLRQALAKTNYPAILTSLPDGDRRRGNLEKLLELAEDSGKITLGKFSRYLADLTTREVREGEAPLEPGNAIRLMTAHASKGLEFPLVVLADASWGRGNWRTPALLADPDFGLSCQVYSAESNKYENGFAHRRSLKLQALKEEAERKRLLYVAATRAQDYLLVSGTVRQDRAGDWTSHGWLKLIIPALGICKIPREPELTLAFAGCNMRIMMPPAPPRPQRPRQSADDSETLRAFEADPARFPPHRPPLMGALPPYAAPLPSHISASELAQLGAYRHGTTAMQRRDNGRRFREIAAGAIPELDGGGLNQASVSPRTLGVIVHEILRFSSFTAGTDVSDDVIRSIAWEKGVTNPAALQSALREIRPLLQRYRESSVYQWIEGARAAEQPVYTELPFIFRRETRLVHGIIDVLLRRGDGEWVIIDYKTGRVADRDFEEHAKRYRLQLGIYAAAAQEQLGLERPPLTTIHYIRSDETIELASADCRYELDMLEATIDEVMIRDAQT